MADPEPERHASSMDDALERFATVLTQAATDRIEAQIPGLVARFEAHGIEVVVLKGPVTRRRLYGDDERRPVADIDVLVDPKSFRRAARVLGEAGYRRYDRHGHSDAFTRDGGDDAADVDLHLTLPYVQLPPRRAFRVFAAHRVTLDVAGVAVAVLDEPAHVVHLAIHAAVNRFDSGQRSFTEWQRGFASLTDAQVAMAESVAVRLGVAEVWSLAERALSDDADRGALTAAVPTWEAVPRVRSVRGFLRSGTPAWVKWRDFQRLVALQLSDDTLNVWRRSAGRQPLASGTMRIRVDKGVRLVAVTASGAKRILGFGRDESGEAPSR